MAVPLHWHNEPLLLLILLGASWFYALATGPLRARFAPPGTPYPRGQAVCFYLGMVLNYLAVGSPLDQFGEDYLFSLHMVQHLIIIYLTPPLLLLGLPWWLTDTLLRPPWIKKTAAFLLHPAVCCTAFVVLFGLWHLPELYEAALRNRSIHILEHVTIFFTALQMWWLFLGPSRLIPPCRYPIRILASFMLMAAHMPILGLLALSENPLYRTYELAPRIIPNFSAMDDQVLGGTMMEMVAALVSVGLLGWSIWGWMKDDDRRNTERLLRGRAAPAKTDI